MTKQLTCLPLSLALLAFSLPAAASIPSAAAAAQQMAHESQATALVPPAAVLAAAPATPQQIWQLRSGLNVAALMCGDQAIAAGYNWLLRAQAPLLARAWSSEQQRFQQSHGRVWQTAQDRYMTGQYNDLANTGNRSRFCFEARTIIAQARMVPGTQFALFAAGAASRLTRNPAQLHLAAR